MKLILLSVVLLQHNCFLCLNLIAVLVGKSQELFSLKKEIQIPNIFMEWWLVGREVILLLMFLRKGLGWRESMVLGMPFFIIFILTFNPLWWVGLGWEGLGSKQSSSFMLISWLDALRKRRLNKQFGIVTVLRV